MNKKFTILQTSSIEKIGNLGQCLYCDALTYKPNMSKKLAKEHILPQALGGNHVLLEACCCKCENMIKRFEPVILKTVLYAPRVSMNVRRKKRRRSKEKFELRTNVQGQEIKLYLPIEDYPTLLFLPKYGPPGILVDREPNMAAMYGVYTKFLPSTPIKQVLHKNQINNFMSPVLDTKKFCQFLAKIAHGYAIAAFQGTDFKPLLLNLIHGKEDSRYHYIGGRIEDEPETTALHEVKCEYVTRGTTEYIVINIRFFSCLATPTYRVVAGYL